MLQIHPFYCVIFLYLHQVAAIVTPLDANQATAIYKPYKQSVEDFLEQTLNDIEDQATKLMDNEQMYLALNELNQHIRNIKQNITNNATIDREFDNLVNEFLNELKNCNNDRLLNSTLDLLLSPVKKQLNDTRTTIDLNNLKIEKCEGFLRSCVTIFTLNMKASLQKWTAVVEAITNDLNGLQQRIDVCVQKTLTNFIDKAHRIGGLGQLRGAN